MKKFVQVPEFRFIINVCFILAIQGEPTMRHVMAFAFVLLLAGYCSAAHAQYAQTAKITGDASSAFVNFGSAVSLSADGNTALIGCPDTNSNGGSAVVFARNGADWIQVATLAGTPDFGASQGYSVALSADGNTALIGGPTDSLTIGTVWVFTQSGGIWTQQARLESPNDAEGLPEFGYSVALSADGNAALIGGPQDNYDPTFQLADGAAWLFTRSGGTWTESVKYFGDEGSGAGTSVSLSADGKTVLIGEPFYSGGNSGGNDGAAKVIQEQGEFDPSLIATLVPSDLVTSSGGKAWPGEVGCSVSLSADGSTALVGGFGDNDFIGAAWVFKQSGGVWAQQGSKLVGTNSVGAPNQGNAVSLSADGNTALVGGFEDSNYIGATWVFTQSGGAWTQQGDKLVGTGVGGDSANQGSSVALSSNGTTALIGGPFDSNGLGAAWVFANNLTTTVAADAFAGYSPSPFNAVLTANVTASSGPVNEGQVKFSVIGTGLLFLVNVSNGVASSSVTVTGLSPNAYVIQADYLGTANFAPSQGFANLTIYDYLFLSAPTATPNPAGVGQTVTFMAVPAGGSLATAWTFGDGTTGAGPTVTHSYTSAGTYTATVIASDTHALSISSTVQVMVLAPLVGTGNDSDGDGFSDNFENAVGTDPLSAASTPSGQPITAATLQTLALSKPSIKLNLAKGGGDSIQFSGTLAVPAGFKTNGSKVYFDVGGVAKVLMLTPNGSVTNGGDTVKISIKAKKGAVAAQTSKYEATFKKGTFAATLANFGLANDNVPAAPVMLPFTFIFNNIVYQKIQAMSYSATKDKSGTAK